MSASHFDPRITAYFGDAVMQAGFMPLPHLFLRHYRKLGLSHVQAMFVLQLMEIAWDYGEPPTNVTKLAKRMGTGRRTVQVCSRELHELGLIEIYEQFDADGSQVENGYDLSPLFRKLSELAPPVAPVGQPRTRRPRGESSASAILIPDQQDTTPNGVQNPVSSPAQNSASPPVQDFAPPGADDIHPPSESRGAPPLQNDSRLKWSQKNLDSKKKQELEEHHHGGVSYMATIGRSLRWKCRLNADEVARSTRILEAIGVHTPIAQVAACTLHPAESWSLWAYARAGDLGPGWVASQIYNFDRRRPRQADLSPRYDEVGRLMDALPWEEALAALEEAVTSSECSGEERVAESAVARAIRDICRPAASRKTTAKRGLLPPEEAPQADWQAACARLADEIGAEEFRTWIRPLRLVEVEGETAIVAAPNVFVRDALTDRYAGIVAEALESELGRPVAVMAVIGGG